MDCKVDGQCNKSGYRRCKKPAKEYIYQGASPHRSDAFYNAYAQDGSDYGLGGRDRNPNNGINVDGDSLGQKYYER